MIFLTVRSGGTLSSVGLAGGERGSRKRQIGLKVRRFGDTQKLIFWQVAPGTGSRIFNILCRLFPKAKKVGDFDLRSSLTKNLRRRQRCVKKWFGNTTNLIFCEVPNDTEKSYEFIPNTKLITSFLRMCGASFSCKNTFEKIAQQKSTK